MTCKWNSSNPLLIKGPFPLVQDSGSGSAHFYSFITHTSHSHCISTPSKPDLVQDRCCGTCQKTLNLPGPPILPLKSDIGQVHLMLKFESSVKVASSPIWSWPKKNMISFETIPHFQRTKLSFLTWKLQHHVSHATHCPNLKKAPLGEEEWAMVDEWHEPITQLLCC